MRTSDAQDRHGSTLLNLTFCLLAIAFPCGCGGEPPARPDILAIPEEELQGASVKSLLFEFRAKVRKRGATAVKQELSQVQENFGGFDKRFAGANLDICKQIDEKLNAMKTALGGTPSAGDMKKLAEEIGELAGKLPGKANENPEVE